MVRLKNTKWQVQQLTGVEVIYSERDGKPVKVRPGDVLLIDQVTGARKVVSPAQLAAQTETVNGVVRDKSPSFTAVPHTAPVTVTTADGRVQQSKPGDQVVTNIATGEVRIYSSLDYGATFE